MQRSVRRGLPVVLIALLAWRVVTPPKAFLNSPLDQGAGPVVATSASSAWVFADRGTDSIYTDALHRTAKGWAAPVRLSTLITAAIALSPANIWAFGSMAAPAISTARPGLTDHSRSRSRPRARHPPAISGPAASSLQARRLSSTGTGMPGARPRCPP